MIRTSAIPSGIGPAVLSENARHRGMRCISRAYRRSPTNPKDYKCTRSSWPPKRAAAAKARSPSASRLRHPGRTHRPPDRDRFARHAFELAGPAHLRRAMVEPITAPARSSSGLQSLARSGVTLTIIDTAGGVSAATTAAIRHADLCLIPSRPSVADIEATASTLRPSAPGNKPFAFVLNQTPIRGQRINNAATVSATRPRAIRRRCRLALHRHAQRSPGCAGRWASAVGRIRPCGQIGGRNSRPLAMGRGPARTAA